MKSIKRSSWHIILLSIIIAALVLAGCGGATEPVAEEEAAPSTADENVEETTAEDAITIAFSGVFVDQ